VVLDVVSQPLVLPYFPGVLVKVVFLVHEQFDIIFSLSPNMARHLIIKNLISSVVETCLVQESLDQS